MPDHSPDAILEALARVNLATSSEQEAPAQRSDYPGGLRVFWKTQKFDIETGRVIFVGGVTALYGPTTLKCDELEIWIEEKKGFARGKVQVLDPEGEINSENLEFDWEKRTGVAENVQLKVGRLSATAERLEIKPDLWTFTKLYATPSMSKRPDLAFRTDSMTMRPGKGGKIRNPELTVLGLKVKVPVSMPYSLDKRIEGLRLPAISFRRGDGLGLAWQSGFILNEREGVEGKSWLGTQDLTSSISADFAAFPTEAPSYTATYVLSTAKPSASAGFVKPLSDLGERFQQSAMESIFVKSPESEDRFFRTTRQTLAVGFAYNQAAQARRVETKEVSKRLEVTGEVGGVAGELGYFGQIRVQNIRDAKLTPFKTRATVNGSASSFARPISDKLSLRMRSDTLLTSSGFGWIRGATTLSYETLKSASLSLQYANAVEFGNPLFEIDRLYSRQNVNLRADYKNGPWTAAVLWKYDMDRRRWYDTEYSLSLASGSFEPFIGARIFPKTFVFGVRLRTQDIFDRLSARTITRTKK